MLHIGKYSLSRLNMITGLINEVDPQLTKLQGLRPAISCKSPISVMAAAVVRMAPGVRR